MSQSSFQTIYFLIKKLGIFLLSLWFVITVTFFLMHAIPGDPFTKDQALPEEILKAMQKHYGLDQPLIYQYLDYLKGLVKLDLGPSLIYQGRLVTEIIQEGFPISFFLGLEALFISLFLGLVLGSVSAIFQGRWQDKALLIGSVLGISIPSFIFATLLQYLLAMKLNLFPVARWGSFNQSILPALSLAALPTSVIAKLTRNSMIEILYQDYIQTAKSKGLSTFKILSRHVLRNAFLPIVTYLGPLTASILTGGFAVEKIFGIPGLGQWFILSISNRDYTVIMGTAIFYSALLMGCVFIVDILLRFLDPRIKMEI